MATDMGRGIIAPDNNDPISSTGVHEMRTLGATTASAINSLDTKVQDDLEQHVRKDEAEQYGIEGPMGPEGPQGPHGEGDPGPPGPGGSIALEETDPGCFVDSEITWMQWPQSGGLPAVWNPNTQAYENPIRVDTSVGTRVFVGNTMIYGDTGWRDVSHLLQDDWTGTAYIKRENNDVSVVITATVIESLHGTSRNTRRRLLSIPHRWYGLGHLAYRGRGFGSVSRMPVAIDFAYGMDMLDYAGSSQPGFNDLGEWSASPINVTYSYPMNDIWPGTLPGTPA